MTYYVTDDYGTLFCKGKEFDSLDAAEAAALRSAKISATRLNNNPHGTARSVPLSLCVWEVIPGNHVRRSNVDADGIQRKGV